MCVDLERTLHPTHPSRSADTAPEELRRVPAAVGPGRLWTFGLAGLVLLALLLVAYFMSSRLGNGSRVQNAGVGVAGRTSVAVWGFKNLSGKPEQNWLSGALSEMLTVELSAGDKLKTIAGENVARTKADMKLPDTESMSRRNADGHLSASGQQLVVLGSYLDVGGQTRVDVRVQDTAKGDTVATLSASEPDANVAGRGQRPRRTIARQVRGGAITAEEAAAVRASQPETADAARSMLKGWRTACLRQPQREPPTGASSRNGT